MARLLSIFSRRGEVSGLEAAHDLAPNSVSFLESGGRLDVALFGDLGEKASDIRSAFADLDGRLVHMMAMPDEISELRRKFEHFLKLYHELASLNVSLAREKERFESDLRDAVGRSLEIEAQLSGLSASAEAEQVKLEKALASIESYEQSMQLLGIAKRDIEERLGEAQAERAALADEERFLRGECEALAARAGIDEQRIAELSEQYQNSAALASSVGDRCKALECDLILKTEQIALLTEENAKLGREAHQLGRTKAQLEKRLSDEYAEMAAAFEQNQCELRARDERLADLESQLKLAQSQHHLLQTANAEHREENEKLSKSLRTAMEAGRQRDGEIARFQAKIARLEGEGEAASSARKQLDQARLALVARVEAQSQTLRECEIDIRRLENEVAGLSQRNQDLEAVSSASIEQLQLRIHELEGQLEHQVNENAYLSSTFARAEAG